MAVSEWDAIVVGAGSAGAVLAARLSENPDVSVLLLEAGLDYRSHDTPAQFVDRSCGLGLTLTEIPDEDPEFFYDQITARRSEAQDVFPYRRGRGLGGSSTINGLVALRAIPEDFERWERLGATGWSYADMLAAYRRMEADHDYGHSPVHGAVGPVPIYREPESGWGGADRALYAAGAALGYPLMDDINNPESTGVSRLPMNIAGDRRVSTNDGYLEPIRDRENLTIRGDSQVARLLLDGRRAVGVELAGGEQLHCCGGGEVILSAGAVHSPAILLRSGIGPGAAIDRLGLDLRADLPVGQGAQDHAILFVELPVRAEALKAAGQRPTNVVIRYSSGIPDCGRNDMMLMATNHNYWFGRATAGLAIQLNEVFSRGELTLAAADLDVEPHLELRLLSDERDMRRMEDGLDRVRALLAHSAFGDIQIGDAVFPEGRDQILREVQDVMHVCATARMGRPGDPLAVVDPDCRVIGFDGLRVVDASVMPEIPRANLNLTVIAMAERMAVLLAQDVFAPAGA